MDVLVRRAEPADLGALVNLNSILFHDDAGQRDPLANLAWPREEGAAYFSRQLAADETLCLVAERERQIVGALVGYVKPPQSWRPIRAAELESVVVQREYRGHQVGQRLVVALLDWCREHGVQRLSVTAYADNAGAIRFYERLGFAPLNLTLERVV